MKILPIITGSKIDAPNDLAGVPETLNAGLEDYYGHTRFEMMQFLPDRLGTVLDVGCGRGRFGATLKETHPQCHLCGIDIEPEVVSETSRIYDETYAGDAMAVIQQMVASRRLFDVVMLNDVLEHLVDPWGTLKAVRRLIGTSGCVVSSIPNVRSWMVIAGLVWRGTWRYGDAGVLDKTHLRFFTASSIQILFESCGYRVERLQGINRASMTWKYHLVNFLLCGKLFEARYPQFAVVARLAGNP
jgi:2-polyprenyl-3-methyl-5-hydroxy-6-metoxy-1,4-benzoquinol methylase